MTLELRFTLPGQHERSVVLNQSRMLIGTLLSNQVVLRADNVDPIHALIEQNPDGTWSVLDLGASQGVLINGRKIDVESSFTEKDTLQVGSVTLEVQKQVVQTMVDSGGSVAVDYSGTQAPTSAPVYEEPVLPVTATVKSPEPKASARPKSKRRRKTLFSPREARPTGDVLEVVAFWDHTVLEVEHFHPDMKGYEKAVIGDPTNPDHHFITGSKGNAPFTLAKAGTSGYTLKMSSSMKARIRKSGKVEKFSGKNKLNLGKRDIAHVKYHSVNYFLMFVNPPKLALPPSKNKDPLFMMLSSAMAVLFLLAVVPIVFLSMSVEKKKSDADDPYQIQYATQKKKPKPIMKPKPRIKQVKKPPVMVPPPKPMAKTPKPQKPKVKPKQVKKPKPMPKNIKQNKLKPTKPVTRNKTVKKPKNSSGGTPSTGSKRPDFKRAGPMIPGPKGRSGGPKGGGNEKAGGVRKGKEKFNGMGVKGGKKNKTSGVNLSKLGLGAGKVSARNGLGSIRTPFKTSGGGLGAGGGTSTKTRGFGGAGNGSSLGIPGSGSGLNNFGSGSGGLLGGDGGRGGLGGSGIGRGRSGRGSGVNIDVPPVDAVSGGGLTPEEIMAVIRANLNQIRHCYNQFLQRSPGRSGTVKVGFKVATSGRVQSAKVRSSSINDSKLKGCITGKIRRWKFPKPRSSKPVDVTYPFNFSPAN